VILVEDETNLAFCLIENSKLFFTMFSNLERTSQFIKYFENSEKIKLSQEWRNVCELMSFKESVVKYFDDILNHLHNKVKENYNFTPDHFLQCVTVDLLKCSFILISDPMVQSNILTRFRFLSFKCAAQFVCGNYCFTGAVTAILFRVGSSKTTVS